MIVQSVRDNFDWSPETELAAPPQLAIAVYRNGRDEIAIRQQDDGFEDGDTLILVAASNGEAVANAILAVAREINGPRTIPAPEVRKPISLGTSGPVVHRPSPADPGSLLAVMEAANGDSERREAAE